jgi:uncharacterized protein (DUF58 family)
MPWLLAGDAVLVVLAWWDSRRASRVVVRAARSWPPMLAQGAGAQLDLEATNHGRRVLRLRVRESLHAALAPAPDRRAMVLAPGTTGRWSIELVPRRRGTHQAGPTVARVLGPWGLAWSQRELVPAEPVKVFPQVRWEGRVGRLLTLAHRHQLGEVPLRVRGGGGEPYAVREYLPGDPMHLIHWKGMARHGVPVTREQTHEAQGRVIVLLDCGRSMMATGDDRSKLDHALATALALARIASSRGDRTTIAAFADGPRMSVRVGAGSRGLEAAYRRLFDLEARLAEPSYERLPSLVASIENRRSTVVVLTSVVDLASAEMLTRAMLALSLRHRPLLVNLEDAELRQLALGPADDADHVFAKVSAMEIMLENRRIATRLRGRGVRAFTTPADRLALQTLETYLEMTSQRR